jgi:predicted phage terminase large subunit-like protein
MDIVETMKQITLFSQKWEKAQKKFIEEKANGAAVIQILSRKLHGLIALEPEGGKESRVNAISPAIESGNYYLPHPAMLGYEWVNGYINQMCSFPQAANDDMVDMTSQGLNKLIYREKDTKTGEGLYGTYTYQMLKMKGYNDYDIKKLWKSGQIKLIGHPWK